MASSDTEMLRKCTDLWVLQFKDRVLVWIFEDQFFSPSKHASNCPKVNFTKAHLDILETSANLGHFTQHT